MGSFYHATIPGLEFSYKHNVATTIEKSSNYYVSRFVDREKVRPDDMWAGLMHAVEILESSLVAGKMGLGGGGGGSPRSRREVCLVHRSSGLRLPAVHVSKYKTQAIVGCDVTCFLARMFAKWHPSVAQVVSPEHVSRMLIIQVLDLFKMNRSPSGLVCMHNEHALICILPP